jgi:hypothetical protein
LAVGRDDDSCAHHGHALNADEDVHVR